MHTTVSIKGNGNMETRKSEKKSVRKVNEERYYSMRPPLFDGTTHLAHRRFAVVTGPALRARTVIGG